MSVHCAYFVAGRCRSCAAIETPYAEQLAAKQEAVRALLSPWSGLHWLPPVASAPQGFRNKAKMAVSGSFAAPRLGIAEADGRSEDLADCLLYPPALSAAFAPIKRLIGAARLPPYDITGRSGDLKFILLTLAEHSGELMLRLVLRTAEAVPRIRRHLPELLAELPQLKVVSANIQPLPAAIVEGPEEIALTDQQHLRLEQNGLPLYLLPGAFLQTNPQVAGALYRQARAWVADCQPQRVWDLYCGVGGFALHCADGQREVIGVEISAPAIDAARRTAMELKVERIRFELRDAASMAEFPDFAGPQLVIANPPRRGLGGPLCAAIERSAARWLIYSSCNPVSLAADLRRLLSMQPRHAQVLDMFPHTAHAETLVLLERRGASP